MNTGSLVLPPQISNSEQTPILETSLRLQIPKKVCNC